MMCHYYIICSQLQLHPSTPCSAALEWGICTLHFRFASWLWKDRVRGWGRKKGFAPSFLLPVGLLVFSRTSPQKASSSPQQHWDFKGAAEYSWLIFQVLENPLHHRSLPPLPPLRDTSTRELCLLRGRSFSSTKTLPSSLLLPTLSSCSGTRQGCPLSLLFFNTAPSQRN